MEKNRRKRLVKAHFIVHGAASGAAAWAFANAQIPGSDEAGLTIITSTMAGSLAFLYGINEAKLVLAMASVALGSALGERTAAQLHKYIPLLGNYTNATSTFALHEGTGWLLVAALERYLVTGILPDLKHMTDEEKKQFMKMADELKDEAKKERSK